MNHRFKVMYFAIQCILDQKQCQAGIIFCVRFLYFRMKIYIHVHKCCVNESVVNKTHSSADLEFPALLIFAT